MRIPTKRALSASVVLTVGVIVLMVALFSVLLTQSQQLSAVPPPTTMNFQGRLANSSNILVADGLYNMQFRIFTVASGGSAVWTETRETTNRVQVTNGLFSVQLGSVTPLSASVFNATDLYFEITMATPATATCSTASCASWESPMTPRNKLATSAYAYNAASLNGLSDTDFAKVASNNTFTGTNTVSVDSATALRVQNTSTVAALTADTSNLRIQVGSSTTDSTAVFFLLDQYNQATDPVNTINGAMYYNTDSNKFRCYQNGAWTDCIGSGGSGANTSLSNLSGVDINAALNATGNDLTLQTTTTGNVNIAPAGVINLQGDTVLAAGNSLTLTGGNTASRPGTPTEGMVYYDSETNQLLTYTGSKWQADRSTATVIVGTSASGGTSSAVASQKPDGADFVNSSDSSAETTINSAISSLPADGGTVYLMEGTYVVDGSILLPSNVTLMGAGQGTVIKVANAVNADINAIADATGSGSNEENITVKQLVVDGNKANNSSGLQYGIYFRDVGNTNKNGVVVEDTIVKNFRSIGVYLHVNVDGARIVENTISGNTAQGIRIDNGSDNNLLSENTIMANGVGVQVAGDDNTLANNYIQDNTGDGVYGGSGADRIMIMDNQVANNGQEGIDLFGNTKANISGNTVRSNGTTGIYLQQTIFSMVNDNVVDSNTQRGIYTLTNSNNQITNNYVQNNLTSGIEVSTNSGQPTLIDGNRIYNNGGSGLYHGIYLLYGNGSQITNNVITDTAGTGYAIYLYSAIFGLSDVYLSNNVFSGTGATTILDNGTNTIYANQSKTAGGLDALYKQVNSASAFQIQNASGVAQLTADTTNSRIQVGSSTTDATAIVFALDNYNQATDPTGVNGAMYYNTDSNKFRCYQNGGWTDCIGAGGGGATTALDNLASTDINAALNATGNNLTLQTTTSGNVVLNAAGTIELQSDTNITSDVTIAAGNSLTLTGGATRPGTPTEGMVFYDTATNQLLTYTDSKWQADRSDAVLVAASNSSDADKAAADFVADGNTGAAADGDQVQINDALTAGAGKKVVLLAGTYVADATILVPNNTTLAGVGNGTLIQLADIDTTDNLIENSDTSTGTGVVIRDMRLDGQKSLNTAGVQHGIYLNGLGSSSTSHRGTISNIEVTNFRDNGIHLLNSSRITIEASIANSNEGGMFITGSSFNRISKNVLTSNSGVGLYLSANSNQNGIENNASSNNSNAGFRIDGSSSNTLTGNTASSNSQGGMHLSGGTENTISGNTFVNNTNWGITIISSSQRNIISDNVFRGSFYGINLNSSDSNVISSNLVADTGNSTANQGIYLDTSDSNTIHANKIQDSNGCSTTCYAIDIFSSTSDNNHISANVFSTGSIRDNGTGTIFANQSRTAGGLDTLHKQANSSTAFQIQNASGVAQLTANTTDSQIALGSSTNLGAAFIRTLADSSTGLQIQNAAGTTTIMTVNSSANTIVIGTGANTITLGANGITLAGTARGDATISLSPEYSGATFTGDGTNNTGSLSSDFCSGSSRQNINAANCGATETHNYYEWTTAETTVQDYDIYVRYQMPQDYSTGSMSNLEIWGWGTTSAAEIVTVALISDASATPCSTSGNAIASNATWAQATVASPLGACTPAAGDWVTFKVRVAADENNFARAGAITFDYKRTR